MCLVVLMSWLCHMQEDWPEDKAVCEQIRADFSPDALIGDRRQELVFIGQVRGIKSSKYTIPPAAAAAGV